MRALLCALALACAVPAHAEGPVPPASGKDDAPRASRPASRVTIGVQVVHATDEATGVDPRLQSLASSFRYFKYKGYRLLSSDSKALAAGGSASFAIAGERQLTVTLVERDDARARVRAVVVKGEARLLDTTVSINRDGTFIVAGPKFGDGILILPLRASY